MTAARKKKTGRSPQSPAARKSPAATSWKAAPRKPAAKPAKRKPVPNKAGKRMRVAGPAIAGKAGGRPYGKNAGRPPTRTPSARPRGVRFAGALAPGYERVLTREALAFVAGLHRRFEAERRRLIARRGERQARFDAGELPDFLPETRAVREADWKIGAIPGDLMDRRVELTGPTDRRMVIDGLNSGANVFMADFEDANSPTWHNMVQGQQNLMDHWRGTLARGEPESGKAGRSGAGRAVLMVRPRGWHLLEAHLQVDGQPVAGALFDFGLYFFHNARACLAKGTGPYFYLPKMESHLEARLWNRVFVHAEKALGLAPGTIKATVLIETLPAAFEMDEILYELKEHIAGLSCGRWDYIFSFIKTFRNNPRFILPDRGQVVIGKAFQRAYSQLLIRTCHRRGAFAIGGTAVQVPNRKDPVGNAAALAKVRADKEREANEGHDGTWVAHVDLVPVAREVFDRLMPGTDQLIRRRADVHVGQRELLEVHDGTRTEAGFRENIRVGVQYLEAWLGGRGAVPLYNLMEDVATAEISRAQTWQWMRYAQSLDGGARITPLFFESCLAEEMEQVKSEIGKDAFEAGRFKEAVELFRTLSTAERFEPFLTVPAYPLLG